MRHLVNQRSTSSLQKAWRSLKHSSSKFRTFIEKTGQTLEQEVAVYVHWPYCKQICTFCNFNKYVRDDVNHNRMRRCLVLELKTLLQVTGAINVKSVYFGGGTPSLANPSTISAILDCITSMCRMDHNAEVTLEANPSSSETRSLRKFKEAGVKRLSLGVQSLCDKDLARLGRDHTVEESLRSIEEAKQLFPGKVSIDLLFGRPYQTLSAWKTELDKILSICDNHLSLYQLTVERGTPLYKQVQSGQVELPSSDLMANLYQLAVEMLENKGFERYEVSSFAKPGSESQHNLAYWNGTSYIGVGPGAHARYNLQSNKDTTRYACVQTPEPNAWMNEVEHFGHATRQAAPQSSYEILEEMLMSGLRTKQGISNKRWCEVAPVQLQNLSHVFMACADVQDLIDADLLIIDNRGVRATRLGMNVLDSVTTPLALHLEKYIKQLQATEDIS